MAFVSQSVLGILSAIQLVLAQDSELNILVTEWSPPRIFHLGLASGKLKTVPIVNILRPVAIDYDPETKDMYWTDVGLHEIRATNIFGTDDRVLLSLNGSAVLDGLAVDVIAKKVFYTDAGNGVIAVIDMNGTNNEVIIDSGLYKPRAIVLHVAKRKLYWTDWGENPYIASADYDGTDIRKIVESGLGWPNGLALDKQNDIIYWCDAEKDTMESVNVDGTHRRLIRNEPLAHYFDISFSHGTLFFTDWARRAVLNIPADGGSIGMVTSTHFTRLAGIHVFSNIDVSACQVGQYGSECEDCGQCKNNTICERTTGVCLTGCSTGYQGTGCKQECSAGTYGDKCQSVCGNCAGGKCSVSDGRCLNGCTPGWQGIDCKIACPTNKYGSSCVPCGQCANNDVCNQLSGYCPSGCQTGWTGNRCDTAITGQDATTQNADETNGLSLLVIVGAVAGGVIVLLIVVIIVIIVTVALLRRIKNPQRIPKPEREYTSLDVLRQSNIYSVPTDSPPAYSSIPELQSTSFSNGRETREYDTSPTYETVEELRTDYLTASYDDNVYARPLSLILEDEGNRDVKQPA